MNQFPPERLLHVTLQAQEWNIVMTALFELPAKASYNVIGRLQQQFNDQSLVNHGQAQVLPAGDDNGVHA